MLSSSRALKAPRAKGALEQALERALLFVLDALFTFAQTLRREHPTLAYAFEHGHPLPTLALAARLVRQAQRLRATLRDYETALDDVIDGAPYDSVEDGF